MINYFSSLAIPAIILIIIMWGLIEKNKIFDVFIEGVKEGFETVIKLFPVLLGLLVAVGTLRASGFFEFIINLVSPIIEFLKVPKEIIPLAIIKPISGSASIAIGTNIMSQYGVDSKIGLIASTIMGSTETVLYAIAIYTSGIEIKKTKFILAISLIGNIVGMSISVMIWKILS